MTGSHAERESRLVVRLLFVVTGLHMIAATTTPSWGEIVRGGLWNTVATNDYPAMTTLWFTLSGIAFGAIGLLLRRAVRDHGMLPPETGWLLLALGVPMSVLEPVSGGWLVIGLGVLALVVTRPAGRSTTRLSTVGRQRNGT